MAFAAAAGRRISGYRGCPEEHLRPPGRRISSSSGDDHRRECLQSMRSLSTALAALGLAHGGLRLWLDSVVRPLPDAAAAQGLIAAALPLSLAFIIRRSLAEAAEAGADSPARRASRIARSATEKKQERPRALSAAAECARSASLLSRRARAVALSCVLGLSAGSVAAATFVPARRS